MWKPPTHDLNAPDLYIPSMAFVTYILLSGYVYGLQDTVRTLHVLQ